MGTTCCVPARHSKQIHFGGSLVVCDNTPQQSQQSQQLSSVGGILNESDEFDRNKYTSSPTREITVAPPIHSPPPPTLLQDTVPLIIPDDPTNNHNQVEMEHSYDISTLPAPIIRVYREDDVPNILSLPAFVPPPNIFVPIQPCHVEVDEDDPYSAEPHFIDVADLTKSDSMTTTKELGVRSDHSISFVMVSPTGAVGRPEILDDDDLL
eukprot:PhF_6_TR41710/c0_g1_i2/m.63281